MDPTFKSSFTQPTLETDQSALWHLQTLAHFTWPEESKWRGGGGSAWETSATLTASVWMSWFKERCRAEVTEVTGYLLAQQNAILQSWSKVLGPNFFLGYRLEEKKLRREKKISD